MHTDTTPDFSNNFTKIFQLAENIRKLRKGFAFSNNDAKAKYDTAFIRKWGKIRECRFSACHAVSIEGGER